MMFNKRRQSQDSVLRERVLALVPGTLYMSAYSAKQFGENAKISVCEGFPTDLKENDFYFAEDAEISPDNIQKIIIYRWNRHYPADKRFEFDLSSLGFEKASAENFIGSSHPTITEEIYKKAR
jgi:hypothetical protein